MTASPQKPESPAPIDEKARKRRNLAIALGLGAFVILVYLTAIVRMSQGAAAG